LKRNGLSLNRVIRVTVNLADDLNAYGTLNKLYVEKFGGEKRFPARAAYALPRVEMPNGALISLTVDLAPETNIIIIPGGTIPAGWDFPFLPVIKVVFGNVERYYFSGIIPAIADGKPVHQEFWRQQESMAQRLNELLEICNLSLRHVKKVTALFTKPDEELLSLTPNAVSSGLTPFQSLRDTDASIDARMVSGLPFGSKLKWVIVAEKTIS